MKTLYLHIGLPKTATSTVQVFLEKNTEQLSKQSCVFPIFPHKYPHVRQQRNAHFFYLPKRDLLSSDPITPPEEWRNRLEECLGEIVKMFESSDKVILSDEDLWWSVDSAPINFLKIMPVFAKNHGYVFKVIVYLRRQDQLMDSLYRTKVKASKTTLTMREWYEDHMRKYPNYLDYEATLKKIADVIGQENVIVRRFEPEFWKENSICMDFLDALGLDITLTYTDSEEKLNPSLKGNMVELQRQINRMDSLDLEEKLQFSNFTKKLSDKMEDPYPYNAFTQEETKAFLKEYEEGNESVAETYIGDGKPLFSDKVEEIPVWDPDNEQMLPDLLRFFIAVTKDQEERLRTLEREVASLPAERVKRHLKNRKDSSGQEKNQESV